MKDRFGNTVPEEIKCNIKWLDNKPVYTGPKVKQKLRIFKKYEQKFLDSVEYEKQRTDTTRNVLDVCYAYLGDTKEPIADLTVYDMLAENMTQLKARYFKNEKDREFTAMNMFKKVLEHNAKFGKLITYTGTKSDCTFKEKYYGLLKYAIWGIQGGILTIDMPKYRKTVTLRARYGDVGFYSLSDTQVYDTISITSKDRTWVPEYTGYNKYQKFLTMPFDEYIKTDMCKNILTKKRLLVDVMVNCGDTYVLDVINGVAYLNSVTASDTFGTGYEYDCGLCKKTECTMCSIKDKIASGLCLMNLTKQVNSNCGKLQSFTILPLVDDILTILFDIGSNKKSVAEIREAVKDIDLNFFKAEVRERETSELLLIDYASINVIEGTDYCNLLDYKEKGKLTDMCIVDDLSCMSERELLEYALNYGDKNEMDISQREAHG